MFTVLSLAPHPLPRTYQSPTPPPLNQGTLGTLREALELLHGLRQGALMPVRGDLRGVLTTSRRVAEQLRVRLDQFALQKDQVCDVLRLCACIVFSVCIVCVCLVCCVHRGVMDVVCGTCIMSTHLHITKHARTFPHPTHTGMSGP